MSEIKPDYLISFIYRGKRGKKLIGRIKRLADTYPTTKSKYNWPPSGSSLALTIDGLRRDVDVNVKMELFRKF